MQLPPARRLGSPLCPRYLGPTLETVFHLLAVLDGRQQMPSGAEVLGNRTIRGQKALGMPRRLEPLHAIFSLACGTMGVLTTVVQIATLPVLHPGQDLALGRAVALQLIGNDHPWYVLQPFE